MIPKIYTIQSSAKRHTDQHSDDMKHHQNINPDTSIGLIYVVVANHTLPTHKHGDTTKESTHKATLTPSSKEQKKLPVFTITSIACTAQRYNKCC